MTCPCNPLKEYSACCGIAHENIHAVSTAEQLMRSRYSAFVVSNIDYLLRSHHSSNRPSKKEALEIKQWTESVTWIKLEILQSTQGRPRDPTGTVEFKAHYIEEGEEQVIHENSKFCIENWHWVYLDAVD